MLRRVSPVEATFLSDLPQPILFVPLLQSQQPLGYLLALDARPEDEPLLHWMAETVQSHLDDAEALQGMTDELIGAWNQLELVYRVTQKLALSSDLMAMLKSILREIRKVVQTEDGFILLQRSESLEYVTVSSEFRDKISPTILDHLAQIQHIVLFNNRDACQAIWPEAPAFVENMLATRLVLSEENAVVALGLVNKADNYFTAGDAKLLAALAHQVGMVIRVYLIHQKLIVEERLSRELEIAAEIQESLLPTNLPQVCGLSLAVASIPASEVGGDFYDFITLDDRRLTLVIGDVAGKGVPAAMLTSMTRTMLRVEAMRGETPHAIIQQANNVLHQDLSRADAFVTAFVATIDTMAGTLSYASAGHAPTLLWRADTRQTELLKATSPPIGIFGYKGDVTRTVPLYPGDTLIFYTDGITEAQAPNGELYGLHRLIYTVESRVNETPEALQQVIQAEVAGFCRNSSTRDDLTLLIVKMLPQTEVASAKDISTILNTVQFSYPANTEHLTDISREVISACRHLPALPPGSGADDFIYLIELAISEICTNIIKHAYAGQEGEITGSITLLSNGVQLDFYDFGAGFDPSSVPQPNCDPHQLVEGGYGLHIVRQIMDVVSYEHHPERGNHWHLIKLLPPSGRT